MKRALAFVLFALAAASSAFGQGRTVVSGTVTDTNGVPYVGGTLVVTLTLPVGAGGATLNGVQITGATQRVTLDSAGSFLMQLPDNTVVQPPGTQWIFNVNISPGVAPPIGTGPQNCSTTLTISGASQNLNLNTCPVLSLSTAAKSPNGATILAWDPKYNLPPPGKWLCDATFTVNSPTVTTPATDIPFLATDSFAIVVGGNAQCGGNPQQVINTLTPPNATATFVGPHTITLSGNALASCTPTAGQGGCALFWGADATAAVQAAFNDTVTGCGSLELPAGGVIFNANVSSTTALCPVTDNGDDKVSAIAVHGQGPFSTMLLFTPNVTFPRAMFSWSSASVQSNARAYLHDFGVASFTSAPAAINNQTGFSVNFNSEFYNVWFLDFFPSNTQNFTALVCNGVIGAVTNCHNNLMINAGFTSMSTNGQDVNIYTNWVQGATKLLGIIPGGAPGSLVTRDNRFTLAGTNGAATVSSGAGPWLSYGDRFNATGTSLPVVSIAGNAGTNVVFHDVKITGAQTTGPSLSIAASNNVTFEGAANSVSASSGTANGITNAGTLTLKNTAFSSTGGTGLNNSGTVIFLTGNTIANGFTNTGTVIGGVGDCASSAGACANASNGSVSIAAGATTVTVNTTAIGANSEVFIQEDSTLGTKLGVTCNVTAGRTYSPTTRTPGTSFVITSSAAPVTNPACLHYSIREGSTLQ